MTDLLSAAAFAVGFVIIAWTTVALVIAIVIGAVRAVRWVLHRISRRRQTQAAIAAWRAPGHERGRRA